MGLVGLGLVGQKCGMTTLFDLEKGFAIPVTVIKVQANRVVQIKDRVTDGYDAIQVTTGEQALQHLNRSERMHFAKVSVRAGVVVKEFRLNTSMTKFKTGEEIPLDIFEVNQIVRISGFTKGKGFAGTIERWNFKGQNNTHGNSISHRKPGSIGQNQSPGRVFKGKKMAGRWGNERCTMRGLKIMKIDKERSLIMIKGAIPGTAGGYVVIRPISIDVVKDN